MWHSLMTGRSPWRGVAILLATVTATELVMLNIIFWAQAQGSISGLMLAVISPWAVALAAPLLITSRQRRLPVRFPNRLTLNPGLTLAIGLSLAALALVRQVLVTA